MSVSGFEKGQLKSPRSSITRGQVLGGEMSKMSSLPPRSPSRQNKKDQTLIY